MCNLKIEVWPVATNKTEFVNPSRCDMAIVKNPSIILNVSFYIHEEDYFVHVLLFNYFDDIKFQSLEIACRN